MSTLVLYETAGNIISTAEDPSGAMLASPSEVFETLVTIEDDVLPDTHYVDVSGIEPVITPKLAFALTLPITPNATIWEDISGIPMTTTVIWPDGVDTVETGLLQFKVPYTGYYLFVFEHPQYLREEVTIYVQP